MCQWPLGKVSGVAAMSSTGAKREVVVGTPLSPDEVKEHLEYLRFLDPRKSWERLDTFAKWLIGSSALVGTLGSGFSSAMFRELSGPGEWLFALAILLVGLSLMQAVRALAPGSRPRFYNPHDNEQMKQVLDEALIKRQRRLFWSATSLAAALVAAALAPLASTAGNLIAAQQAAIGFSFEGDGGLRATVKARGIPPFTPVTLHVHVATGGLPRGLLLGAGQAIAKDDGRVDLTVHLPREQYRGRSRLLAVASWAGPRDLREVSSRIDIPAQ